MARFRTIRGFRDFDKEMSRESLDIVHEEMKAASVRAKEYAQANAPVDTGFHRRSISRRARKNKRGSTISLEGRAPYAPFLEFGTGVYVSIPSGFEDIAAQFKGESSITGMRARPHLIPAMRKAAEELDQSIAKKLSGL